MLGLFAVPTVPDRDPQDRKRNISLTIQLHPEDAEREGELL